MPALSLPNKAKVKSEKAEEQRSRGAGEQGSRGAIAHKGRGFEPYLFRKKAKERKMVTEQLNLFMESNKNLYETHC
ncbi:MAG: hypothetical protein V7L26_32255 [Nostoc sp.]|uniref:hypothetical protein n=1 Tax=Nostoc sp. TaxID=1180 RepID=UPI002FFAA677